MTTAIAFFQLGARGFNMTFKEPPGTGNNKPNKLVMYFHMHIIQSLHDQMASFTNKG